MQELGCFALEGACVLLAVVLGNVANLEVGVAVGHVGKLFYFGGVRVVLRLVEEDEAILLKVGRLPNQRIPRHKVHVDARKDRLIDAFARLLWKIAGRVGLDHRAFGKVAMKEGDVGAFAV